MIDSFKELPILILQLSKIVSRLEQLFPGKKSTLDGHLVGSIGEAIAQYLYKLGPLRSGTACHDCVTNNGGNVQIKFTAVKKASSAESVGDLGGFSEAIG
jgi:hypothetical protein